MVNIYYLCDAYDRYSAVEDYSDIYSHYVKIIVFGDSSFTDAYDYTLIFSLSSSSLIKIFFEYADTPILVIRRIDP